jgi:hypothetical protein
MATKTIPEYLENERRRSEDTQLRREEEADRIRLLHPGHHRTRKQPNLELSAPVEVVVKAKKPAVVKARKPPMAKVRKPAVAKARKRLAAKTTRPAGGAGRKSPAARKTGTKARRTA